MIRDVRTDPCAKFFRCYLDGEDVSQDACACDPGRGKVVLYRRTEKGRVSILRACSCGIFPKPWPPACAGRCNACGGAYEYIPETYIARGEVRLELRPWRERLAICWQRFRARIHVRFIASA